MAWVNGGTDRCGYCVDASPTHTLYYTYIWTLWMSNLKNLIVEVHPPSHPAQGNGYDMRASFSILLRFCHFHHLFSIKNKEKFSHCQPCVFFWSFRFKLSLIQLRGYVWVCYDMIHTHLRLVIYVMLRTDKQTPINSRF